MNQHKLKVIKQEMARVNIDILGISELKWTGMGEFNSDDHYLYCCGQESLRRNGVPIMVNKKVQNAVLGCNLKKAPVAPPYSQNNFHMARYLYLTISRILRVEYYSVCVQLLNRV